MADKNARSVVFMPSNSASLEGSSKVSGYDFNNGVDYNKILNSYLTTGFQATNFGKAIQEINKMVSFRLVFVNHFPYWRNSFETIS